MSKPVATKQTFHIPAAEQHVADLIELVAQVTGQTPSSWVYGTVMRRLKDVGLLDEQNKIVQAKYEAVLAELPPGQKDTKHEKNRST